MSKNQFTLHEFAGAFGDLGTLIPFVVAYISVLKIDPTGILIMFGVWLILVGAVFKTPFPVQPMKAIGAAAIAQPIGAVVITPAIVTGAGLVTGLLWLILAATGMAGRLAKLMPKLVMLGVIIGLGLTFMLKGIDMMSQAWALSIVIICIALFLPRISKIPAVLVLLLIGFMVSVFAHPELVDQLMQVKPKLDWPDFAWASLAWSDIWLGAILLALPQLPLTFGNALVAITEENNTLFPDRKVTENRVAFSTGLMNLSSSVFGGVPMCHGAGGMAGHVRFGAQTGGASIILGFCLLLLGGFFSDSIILLFGLLPPAVLGAILFLAGTQLATSGRLTSEDKSDQFVILVTAALTIVNVGVAVLAGLVLYHANKRKWLKL